MLIQALALISGLMFLTTLVLATNFTVAKNIANQKMAFALQIASSRSLNDAQTWARDTLALEDSEKQTAINLRTGSGSQEVGCVDINCTFKFIETWTVGGDFADPESGQVSIATNIDNTVAEGRAAMIVTTRLYNTTLSASRPIASRYQLVTGRYLNVQPFFVITASNDVSGNKGFSSGSEGDTAGVGRSSSSGTNAAYPIIGNPASYLKTTLQSEILCYNSVDGRKLDAKLDVPVAANMPSIPVHAYVPSSETLVWIFEAPCIPPAKVLDVPDGTDVHSTDQYLHEGTVSRSWSKGDYLTSAIKE